MMKRAARPGPNQPESPQSADLTRGAAMSPLRILAGAVVLILVADAAELILHLALPPLSLTTEFLIHAFLLLLFLSPLLHFALIRP